MRIQVSAKMSLRNTAVPNSRNLNGYICFLVTVLTSAPAKMKSKTDNEEVIIMVNIDAIGSILKEGEDIEWIGKAEPFKLFDSVHKKSLLSGWAICIGVALALTVAYTFAISGNTQGVNAGVIVFIVGLPLFIMIRPALDKMGLKKIAFVMTNKRAIVFTSSAKHSGMELEKIDEAVVLSKNNGTCDVVFGSAVSDTPEHKLRYLTMMPKNTDDEEKTIVGMAFYNIADADKIRGLSHFSY